MRVVAALLGGFLCAGESALKAQQIVTPASDATAQVSLTDMVRRFPEYAEAHDPLPYLGALENATIAERDAALPALMQWCEDKRSVVRSHALFTLWFLYMPSEKRPEPPFSNSLPIKYIAAVAAHLLDPDRGVRPVTSLALRSTEYSGIGLDDLVRLVVPMLREPDVVIEYPDPGFAEAEKQMLAGMTPQQQAEFKAMPRKPMMMPAVGQLLLDILATPRRQPSDAVDDAMIAFLDRDDMTQSTLQECLHVLALSRASERVNDEALRRVFERKAMTIFLLQFVENLRLTPAQLDVEKTRLVALSNDESAHPALRRSARDVAVCWNGNRTKPCKPSDEDLSQQLDTK